MEAIARRSSEVSAGLPPLERSNITVPGRVSLAIPQSLRECRVRSYASARERKPSCEESKKATCSWRGLSARKPTATRHWVAGAIDAVHPATMLVLAAADRRSRRAAIAYAALAVVFASADVRAGRMSRDLL